MSFYKLQSFFVIYKLVLQALSCPQYLYHNDVRWNKLHCIVHLNKTQILYNSTLFLKPINEFYKIDKFYNMQNIFQVKKEKSQFIRNCDQLNNQKIPYSYNQSILNQFHSSVTGQNHPAVLNSDTLANCIYQENDKVVVLSATN